MNIPSPGDIVLRFFCPEFELQILVAGNGQREPSTITVVIVVLPFLPPFSEFLTFARSSSSGGDVLFDESASTRRRARVFPSSMEKRNELSISNIQLRCVRRSCACLRECDVGYLSTIKASLLVLSIDAKQPTIGARSSGRETKRFRN